MLILNLVWPALFVITELWRAWLLIFATVFIEALAVKGILSYTLSKSVWVSFVGNLFSALIGTFFMVWVMILWHIIFDKWFRGTFNKWNWIATFILMYFGSTFLEIYALHLWQKETVLNLILPMSLGNLITYIVIARSIYWKEVTGELGDRPF